LLAVRELDIRHMYRYVFTNIFMHYRQFNSEKTTCWSISSSFNCLLLYMRIRGWIERRSANHQEATTGFLILKHTVMSSHYSHFQNIWPRNRLGYYVISEDLIYCVSKQCVNFTFFHIIISCSMCLKCRVHTLHVFLLLLTYLMLCVFSVINVYSDTQYKSLCAIWLETTIILAMSSLHMQSFCARLW